MSVQSLADLKRWPHRRHNDLVVIDQKFLDKFGDGDRNQVLDELCLKLKCNRLAVESKISSDELRTPVVRLVRGDNPWVTHKDNGVVYTLDITKCMFSFGNIKEKLRVSAMDCTDETVVDLFAGIGYFSLVFAVHTNAKLVHMCEWNPNAVTALKKNIDLNRVSDKCVVHSGDNRKICPVGVADRVYMGLIPTSLESLEVGCRALDLNSTKRILHIHHNVSHFGAKTKTEVKDIWNKWSIELCVKVKAIMSEIHPKYHWNIRVLEINKVKPYAPHIDHLVLDLECQSWSSSE